MPLSHQWQLVVQLDTDSALVNLEIAGTIGKPPKLLMKTRQILSKGVELTISNYDMK
jgi:hypothetical protein